MGNTSSVQELTGVDPIRPHRPPISSQSGAQALSRAEHIDGYRKRVFLSRLNYRARAGQIYTPAVYPVQKEIPNPDSTEPWPSGQVVWMNSTADGGLPHTRPPYYICMPETFPTASLETTMRHERIHIHQRMYPEEWVIFIESAWPFKVWKNAELPHSLLEQERLNPDLLWSPRFIWKENYVPIAVFNSLIKPKLNDVNICWYTPSHGIIVKDQTQIPEWSDFFGSQVRDAEHPYEIAAYLLSDKNISCPAKSALLQHIEILSKKDRF